MTLTKIQVTKLLEYSQAELKDMGKEKVHELFKTFLTQLIYACLMDIAASHLTDDIPDEDCEKKLPEIIKSWVESHTIPATDDWEL